MASLFNTLNIGYSGLNAAQVAVDTTSQNITNAEVEGYTRQRVVTSAATPLSTADGNVGNGTEVDDITRIFDSYVFDSYRSVSADKEYSDYDRQKLEELSTYFPDIDGVGIKADLSAYYDSWQTFADNPDNDAAKVALSEQTQTLTEHINQTQSQVLDLQNQVNDEIVTDVNEVNDLASQLADLNTAIDIAESGNNYTANDLRDQRNVLERDLSKLIGSDVNVGEINSNIGVDSNINETSGSYTLSVNGFNIVDGGSYHPLTLTQDNQNGFYEISYERQDGVLIPMEETITGGKIGAELDLRGGTLDTTSGIPTDGTLQKTANDLDAFAKGLIESTNNLYAQSSATSMTSNILDVNESDPLVSSGLDINQGSFDVIIYDIDGNEVSRRPITIDDSTTMSGDEGSNSIEGQLSANIDDNEDANANNDVDDYINYSYQASATGEQRLEFVMDPDKASQGYTFAIADTTEDGFASGTNFAGATGLGGFFEGDNASNITLKKEYRDNPGTLSSGYSSTSGDNNLALDMVQQQFESYEFNTGSQTYDTTLYGMYDLTATYVGVSTNSAITQNDSITAQYNATELEYFSVSKVNTDEEMTNLIKYQTAYSASAKIITTVDQMMQTLLGLKQ